MEEIPFLGKPITSPLSSIGRVLSGLFPGSADTLPSRSVLSSQPNLLELSRALALVLLWERRDE